MEHWEVLPPMLIDRALFATIVCGEFIYLLGGQSMGRPTPMCTSFHVTRGKWQSAPQMRVGRVSCSAATVGSLLYVVGGLDLKSDDSIGEVLDVGVGRWQLLPMLPTLNMHIIAAAALGKLYIFRFSNRAACFHECTLTLLDRASSRIRWVKVGVERFRFRPAWAASLLQHIFLAGSETNELVSLDIGSGFWSRRKSY